MEKMNLIIDIGNTAAKIALFDGDSLVDVVHDSNRTLERLPDICSHYDVERAIMVTVVDLSEEAEARLCNLPCPLLRLGADTPLPVENLYETPETLGYDRMAAVVGACGRFPGRDILVIDAGTCITYELVDAAGRYHGNAEHSGKFPVLPARISVACAVMIHRREQDFTGAEPFRLLRP